MADLSDVERALAKAASAALYPEGQGAVSVAGTVVTVRRGWPISDKLDADIQAGKAQVTAFSRPGTGRLTTRFLRHWQALPDPDEGVSATVQGSTAVFAGTASAAVDAGVRVHGVPYVVHLPAGAVAAQVAVALAALVPGAQASGASVTVPGCRDLVARAAYRARSVREVRRQTQVVALTTWAPTPEARDQIAAAIDAALAPLTFLALPDGSMVRLQYAGSATMDETSKAAIWRRDLTYLVEYPTLEHQDAPRVLFPEFAVTTRGGPTLVDRVL